MTDEEIIKKVLADKHEFGKIIDRYEDKIRRYIKRISYCKDDDVDDLVQEVFINTYEKLNSYSSEYSFSSWIYRIAHNKTIDFIKKKKIKLTNIDNEELFENSKNELLEDLAMAEDDKKRVRQALKKLGIKYRNIINLFYFEGKSYIEISDILKISVSKVGVLLYRARKELKKILTDEN